MLEVSLAYSTSFLLLFDIPIALHWYYFCSHFSNKLIYVYLHWSLYFFQKCWEQIQPFQTFGSKKSESYDLKLRFSRKAYLPFMYFTLSNWPYFRYDAILVFYTEKNMKRWIKLHNSIRMPFSQLFQHTTAVSFPVLIMLLA